MTTLISLPEDTLELICNDLELSDLSSLWLSGDVWLQKRLLKSVRHLNVSARLRSPLFDWRWLNHALYSSLRSLNIDGDELKTSIADFPLEKLPQTLRRLEIQSPDSFTVLLRSITKTMPQIHGQTLFPPLQHLFCSGFGFQERILRDLPTTLISLRFHDPNGVLETLDLLSTLPPSLQILSLHIRRIEVPNKIEITLPNALTDLSLQFLNQDTDWSPNLPTGLKRLFLAFETASKPTWDWSKLPKGLEIFSMPRAMPQPCLLPKSLTSLDKRLSDALECDSLHNCKPNLRQLSGYQVNTVKDFQTLPKSLMSLRCSFNNGQQDMVEHLPSSITDLELYVFQKPSFCDFSKLPFRLTRLECSRIVSDDLVHLPKTLLSLSFRCDSIPKEHAESLSKLKLQSLALSTGPSDDIILSYLPSTLTYLSITERTELRFTRTWPTKLAHLQANLRFLRITANQPVEGFEWSLFGTLRRFASLKTLIISKIRGLPLKIKGLPPNLQTLQLDIVSTHCILRQIPESVTDLTLRTIFRYTTTQEVVNLLPKFVRMINISSKGMQSFTVAPGSIPICLYMGIINRVMLPRATPQSRGRVKKPEIPPTSSETSTSNSNTILSRIYSYIQSFR